jgi:hypothetical protein
MTEEQPIKAHVVQLTLFSRVVKALAKLPYGDVAELMADLQTCPIVDVRQRNGNADNSHSVPE